MNAVKIPPKNLPPKAKAEEEDTESMGDPDYQMSADWAPVRREPSREPGREPVRPPVPHPRDPARLPSRQQATSNDNDVDNRK